MTSVAQSAAACPSDCAATDAQKKSEFRVWWVPQVPMEAFRYPVPSYAAGKLLDDALGRYDHFQFENKVKPDYCNAGGIEWRHPEHTGGEWEDAGDELAEEFGWPLSLEEEAGTTDPILTSGRNQ